MSTETDPEYFARRERAARALAAKSSDPAAARAHLALAERYAAAARMPVDAYVTPPSDGPPA